MKKFPLVKLFAIALILLGTPLEAYYYWYSFTQEARDKMVSVKIGINTGLYEYYASLLGDRIPAHWLQFIKHTILSIFLMLASPTGVKLWLSYRSYTKKKLFGQEEIPNVLSLHKAADLCGISHTILYNAWKKGRLKVEGTPAKVEKEELVRFMGEREKTNAITKKDVSYLWKGNEDAQKT